jgi:hypothetical protein
MRRADSAILEARVARRSAASPEVSRHRHVRGSSGEAPQMGDKVPKDKKKKTEAKKKAATKAAPAKASKSK